MRLTGTDRNAYRRHGTGTGTVSLEGYAYPDHEAVGRRRAVKSRCSIFKAFKEHKMSAVVIVGAQWGDEGKGKATDLLGPSPA